LELAEKGRREIDRLEKVHFKALRVVVCDYRQRMNRELISAKTNGLSPHLW